MFDQEHTKTVIVWDKLALNQSKRTIWRRMRRVYDLDLIPHAVADMVKEESTHVWLPGDQALKDLLG